MKFLLFFLFAASTVFAAPQAIVFDFGGVMTGQDDRDSVVRFLRTSLHLSETEFEKVQLEKRQAVKAGKTDEEFWLSYAKYRGIQLPRNWSKALKATMKKAIGANPEMFALVDELKEKEISVALLSNIDERLGKLVKEFGLYEPFDICLLSYEIGVEKPNAKAYTVLLDRLALPAKDVVFIDDKMENVEAAKQLGIEAILFESPEHLRQELKRLDIIN